MPRFLRIGALAAVFLFSAAASLLAQDLDREPDVLYIPTPQLVVEKMLRMADVQPGELLYDLGSGDGRIVITAVRDFGARGVGIDIDRKLVEESWENAREAGVEDRVQFIHGDLFESDFSDADAVTVFLLTDLNIRLKPQLFEQLRPGVRVVSHLFEMGDWEPDQVLRIPIENRVHEILLWVIPADVQGRWLLTVDGEEIDLAIEQFFQMIRGEAVLDGRIVQFDGAELHGTTIKLRIQTGDILIVLEGEIDGDVMQGDARHVIGDRERTVPWRAVRKRAG